jgi:hypothetical protein
MAGCSEGGESTIGWRSLLPPTSHQLDLKFIIDG